MHRRHPRLRLALITAGIGALAAGCHAPEKASSHRPAAVTAPPAWTRAASLPRPDQALGLAPWPFSGQRADAAVHRVATPGGFALLAAGGGCEGCRPGLAVTYFVWAAGSWRMGRQWLFSDAGPVSKIAPIATPSAFPLVGVTHVARPPQHHSDQSSSLQVIELAPSGPVVRAKAIPLSFASDPYAVEDKGPTTTFSSIVRPLKDRQGVELRYSGNQCQRGFARRVVRYAGARAGGPWTADAPAPTAACPADPRWPYPSADDAYDMLPDRFMSGHWARGPQFDLIVPMGKDFALLASGGRLDCHGCEAELWVAYFRRAGRGWRVARIWPRAFVGSEFGMFDGVNMIDAGLANPAVAIRTGRSGEGCFVEKLSVIELTAHGPVARLVDAPFASNNGGETDSPADRLIIDGEILPPGRGGGLRIHYAGHQIGRVPIDDTIAYFGEKFPWTAHPAPFTGDCMQ